MSDSPVNPELVESRALIVWRDPREVLGLIRRQRIFQLSVNLPVVQECSFKNLIADIELQYYYADGTGVPKASFVLEGEELTPLMAGPLDNAGHRVLTVPTGRTYTFYFHDDAAPDGSVFQFHPKFVQEFGAPKTEIPEWESSAKALGRDEKRRLHWGKEDWHTVLDPTHPALETLILHVVQQYLPLPVEYAAHQREAALLLEALLLEGASDRPLWNRLVINRIGFGLKQHSLLLQALVMAAFVRTDCDYFRLISYLNSAGKGNGPEWLRTLDLLAEAQHLVAHLSRLLDALKSEFEKIAILDTAGTFNIGQARRLTRRCSELRDLVRQHVRLVFNPLYKIVRTGRTRPAFRYRKNVSPGSKGWIRQDKEDLEEYVPGPVALPPWLEVRYLYPDTEDIKDVQILEAEFEIWDVTDDPPVKVEGGELDEHGLGFAQVQFGRSYEFRFHSDQKEFTLLPIERADGPSPALDWIDRVFQDHGNPLLNKKLVWGKTSQGAPDFALFGTDLSLNALLHVHVSAAGLMPRIKFNDDDLASERTVAMLLRAILYAKKDSQESVKWWIEISLHRLRAIPGPDCPVVERLIALLHETPDLKWESLLAFLNFQGRGNAIKWLAALKDKFETYRNDLAANIERILKAVDDDLKKIAEPAQEKKDKVSASNIRAAARVRERIAALPAPADALAAVWKQAGDNLERLLNAKDPLRKGRAAVTFNGMNTYKQEAVEWPKRQTPDPAEPGWVEMVFLYADGTPVKKARYELTGDLPLEDELDNFGFAFEIVDPGKNYTCKFTQDPNPFVIAPPHKLNANAGPIAADLMDQAIAANAFQQGKSFVRWGDTPYTDGQAFQQNPGFSQLAGVLVQNHSPHVASTVDHPNDHNEMAALLTPLVMGAYLEPAEREGVWDGASFHRLGSTSGEFGGVIRDFLWWLSREADPKLADALKRLNGIGTGDALAWLKAIDSNALETGVKNNLTTMLDALVVAMQKLVDAGVLAVSPLLKRFAAEVVKQAGAAKNIAAAQVQRAFTPVWQKLQTIVNQTPPVYGGPALLRELNEYQLEGVKLDRRPPAPIPQLDWVELHYKDADGDGIGQAHYLLTATDGGKNREGVLDDAGFAHLVVPRGHTFEYKFRRDPTVYAPTVPCLANPHAFIANYVATVIGARGFEVGEMEWGTPAFADQDTFERQPCGGNLAFNVVRKNTPFNVPLRQLEEEMTEILYLLAMRQLDNTELWRAAAFNRLAVTLGAEGPLISDLLYAIDQHRRANLDANPPLKDVVKWLNAAGKGNAVRWLEALSLGLNGHRDTVANNLTAILTDWRVDLNLLVNSRFVDARTKAHALRVVNRIGVVLGGVGAAVGNALFTTMGVALQAILGGVIKVRTGTINALNERAQKRTPLNPRPRYQTPPWIEIQYRYVDHAHVANCPFRLVPPVLPGAGPVDNTLDAHGFYHLSDFANVNWLVHFRDEPLPYTVLPAFQRAGAPSAIGVNTQWMPANIFTCANNFYVNQFFPPINAAFDWGNPDFGGGNLNHQWQNNPCLGKIVRVAVSHHACVGPHPGYQPFPEENQLVEHLRKFLILNRHADAPLWTSAVSAAMGLLADPQIVVKRAVLFYLLFNPAPDFEVLMGMLNKGGKGNAMTWLRQLSANFGNLKNSVKTLFTNILTRVRNDLNFFATHPDLGGGTPLELAFRNRMIALRTQTQNTINVVNARVDAVMDPMDLALQNLINLAPKPRILTPVTLRKLNIIRQPVKTLEYCHPNFVSPPAWQLAPAPTAFSVNYKDATNAHNDVQATFYVEGLVNSNNGPRTGTWNVPTPVPVAQGEVRYCFDKDVAAYTVYAPMKPFGTPFPNLAANFLDVAANNNVFQARNDLPWGKTELANQAAFQQDPTMGRIVAGCVRNRMNWMSDPDSYQQVVIACARLLHYPDVERRDDEWFRAAVNLMGAIPDHGCVIKGCLLYARRYPEMEPKTLLELLNFAGNGNAVNWLKAQVTVANNPHFVTIRTLLAGIFTDLHACMNTIANWPNAQVSPGMQGFMGPWAARAQTVSNAAPNHVPRCFEKSLATINRVLNELPRKFLAYPVSVYTRESAIDFEAANGISVLSQQAVSQQADANIRTLNTPNPHVNMNAGAGNPVAPYNQVLHPIGLAHNQTWKELYGFLTNTRGQQAKTLAPILAQQTRDEFLDYMAANCAAMPWVAQASPNGNRSWTNPDGTLIRYKADGDDYQKPSCPTYSIEVVKSIHVTGPPQNKVAFKVDSHGNAVPKGPQDMVIPNPPCDNGAKRQQYLDAISKLGHRPLRY